MKRTLIGAWVEQVCLLCLFCVSGLQAQEPVAAEPQGAGQTVQLPPELVPVLPVPRLVKFAGTLKDEFGKPRTGTVGITFAIYKEEAGGAALWLETQNVELDEQGRYTVLLGASKSEGLPLELFVAGEPRWLGVQVNLPREVEQARVLLVSVPYALKAADAESLGGLPASAYALATPGTLMGSEMSGTGPAAGSGAGPSATQTGSGGKVAKPGKSAANPIPNAASCLTPPCAVVTNGGTTSQLAKFSDATTIANSAIFENSGKVGIGNTNPTRTLDVSGEIRVGGGNIFMQRNLTDLAGRRNWAWGSETFNVGDVSLFVSVSNITAPSLPVFTALSNGNMGVGLATPAQKLSVAGMIQSTTGGVMFPDATVQTTAAQIPAASLVRAITYLAGCDSCGLLTTADSQNAIFVNLIGSMTINSVTCFSDAGAPTVNIQLNHGGTLTNILAADLTCSTTGATTSSFSTSALSLSDILNFIMATADGMAKRVTVIIKATVN